ncbi:MAG: hypothetical protein AMXMBFR82_38090 [Candidatus Hydrogenedentota bacterium]
METNYQNALQICFVLITKKVGMAGWKTRPPINPNSEVDAYKATPRL